MSKSGEDVAEAIGKKGEVSRGSDSTEQCYESSSERPRINKPALTSITAPTIAEGVSAKKKVKAEVAWGGRKRLPGKEAEGGKKRITRDGVMSTHRGK